MTLDGVVYLYLAGVIYFALAMGHQRNSKPQNGWVDLFTALLILLWPIMFTWGAWSNARRHRSR